MNHCGLLEYIYSVDKRRHLTSLVCALLLVLFNIGVAVGLKFFLENDYREGGPLVVTGLVILMLILIDILTVFLIRLRSELNKSVVISLNKDFSKRVKNSRREVDQGFLLTSVGQDTTMIGSFSSEMWRTLIPGAICLVTLSIYLSIKYSLVTSFSIIISILPLIFLPMVTQKLLSGLYYKTKSSNDDLNNILAKIIENSLFIKSVDLKEKSKEILNDRFQEAGKRSAISSSAMLFFYSLSFNNTIMPVTFIAFFMYMDFIPGSVGDFFELIWIIQLFSGYIVGIPTAFSQFINARTSYDRLNNLKFAKCNEEESQLPEILEILNEEENYFYLYNAPDVDWFGSQADDLLSNDVAIGNRKSWIVEGSLRNNLTLGKIISDEKLLDSLQVACLTLEELELNNLDENGIESGGKNISHGQKGRLILARMICLSSKLNIVEGIISTLDASTAQKVLENLSSVDGKWLLIEKGSKELQSIGSFKLVEFGRFL